MRLTSRRCAICKRTVNDMCVKCYTDPAHGFHDAEICKNCLLEHCEKYYPDGATAKHLRWQKNEGYWRSDEEMYKGSPIFRTDGGF